jgi:two-component system sensor histidine kinase KdpD
MTGFQSQNRSNPAASMADNSSKNQSDPLSVPWSDLVRFVRQLSHDLRNDLNALELQSSYIAELAQDQELTAEIKRLREIVSGVNSTLQSLSRAVGEVTPNMISYRASDLLADMRTEIERKFSNKSDEIKWNVQLEDVMLQVDPQLLQQVFVELFTNAFQHERGNSAVVAKTRVENDRLLFTLHEPKTAFDSATHNWGREPLRNISQRHYGLGLNRVRAIVEAHGGELQAHYDAKDSSLLTTITLPFSRQ